MIVGNFNEPLIKQLVVYRPLMAGKVTMTEIKTGTVTLAELMTINSLLDQEIAQQHAASGDK